MPTSLTWESIFPILAGIIAGVAPTLVLRWFDRNKTTKETEKLKAEAENEEAEQRLRDLQFQKEMLSLAKTTVNESLEQMRQDLGKVTAENEGLRKINAVWTTENERLRKVNEAQTKEIQNLLTAGNELKRINQDLRKQNDDLRLQNVQLRETVKQQEAKYAAREQELDRKIKVLETTLSRLDAKSL